ncbi:MAG: hypothetical protein RMM08_09070 [Armatimonadota bacterium]|nr:hypothetical protein [bacterium]MDW8321502.1 hypothetical protein [Armatimonadota bacterium]
MQVTRSEHIIMQDGEIHLTGLPYKRGEIVDVIVLPRGRGASERRLTVRQMKQSGIIGIWKDRKDIADSSEFARRLRDQAQKRGIGS